MTGRMGWLCEDCFEWVATLELAELHCDEWKHSLGPCPERNRGLRMWTIYDHPTDFPEHWVVRPGRALPNRYVPAPRAWPFDTLEQCHEFLAPFHLTLLQRGDPDEPNIAEVWL